MDVGVGVGVMVAVGGTYAVLVGVSEDCGWMGGAVVLTAGVRNERVAVALGASVGVRVGVGVG